MLTFPAPERALVGRHARCLRCGYILEQLENPRCPECGNGFDPRDPLTYTRKPAFVFWKYWLPGVILALASGLLLTAPFLMQGSPGWGLFAAPFSIGGLLGYAVRTRTRIIVLLCLAVLIGVVTALMMAQLAGVFCGFILAIVFLVPALIGVGAGVLLRNQLKTTQFSQKWYLPLIGFLLLPPIAHGAERLAGFRHPPELLCTTCVMHVPLERAWNSQLTDDPKLNPPTPLMHVGLPRPLEPSGPHSQVGKIKAIRFSKGQLTVRTTERVENRTLAFQFIGQNHVEDRAILLLDSRFDFQSLGPDETRVSITTRYQPLMTPRWYWRPLERLSGQSVHQYMLDEMNRDAGRNQALTLSHTE